MKLAKKRSISLPSVELKALLKSKSRYYAY